MENNQRLDADTVDALSELGNIGMGNAMTALYELTRHRLDMYVPKLQIVTYHNIYDLLENINDILAAVMLPLTGDIEGAFIFIMEERLALALMTLAAGEAPDGIIELGEMEQSILCEVGNIISGAYVTALANMTELSFYAGLPSLCVDMGGAILGNSLFPFLHDSDDILFIETGFYLNHEDYSGRIMFLPKGPSLDKMIQRLGL